MISEPETVKQEINARLLTIAHLVTRVTSIQLSEGNSYALLDRLGHHSHILTTRGSSYRSRNREREEDTGGRSDEKGVRSKPMDS